MRRGHILSVELEGPGCLLQRVHGGVSVTGVAPSVSGNTHVRVGMSFGAGLDEA